MEHIQRGGNKVGAVRHVGGVSIEEELAHKPGTRKKPQLLIGAGQGPSNERSRGVLCSVESPQPGRMRRERRCFRRNGENLIEALNKKQGASLGPDKNRKPDDRPRIPRGSPSQGVAGHAVFSPGVERE